MRRALPMAALVLLPLLAGCTDESDVPELSLESWCPEFTDADMGNELTAVLTTNFGVIRARLFVEEAPNTVANFVMLAESGKYDGTPFHRIITDFMMQGGGNFDTPEIEDEFHTGLTHDRAGLLSMANAGPHTGSNQFFITFRDTHHLDDRHSIFGEVVEGMEVVEQINEEASSGPPGTPRTPVTLESVEIARSPATAVPEGQVELSAFVPRHKVSTDGGLTGFVIVAESQGDARQNVTLEAEGADGTEVMLECEEWLMPAGQRVALVVRARVEGGSAGDVPITITAGGQETEPLTLIVERSAAVKGEPYGDGDAVKANYVGITVDGQVFDTSRIEVSTVVGEEELGYDLYRARSPAQYTPFTFEVGGNVIGGFSKLADGIQPGGADAGRMDGEDVYPWSGCKATSSCLGGRTLIFDLETVP